MKPTSLHHIEVVRALDSLQWPSRLKAAMRFACSALHSSDSKASPPNSTRATRRTSVGSSISALAGAAPSSNACGERNHSASPQPVVQRCPFGSRWKGPDSRNTPCSHSDGLRADHPHEIARADSDSWVPDPPRRHPATVPTAQLTCRLASAAARPSQTVADLF